MSRPLASPAAVRAERIAERLAPVKAARSEPRAYDRMNKTERRYAAQLEARRLAGDITWWGFEVVTLRLADGTHYRIDFALALADGTLELHDVKGRKGSGPWVEEDAKLKIKVAAEQFPFRFRLVWPHGKSWLDQEI